MRGSESGSRAAALVSNCPNQHTIAASSNVPSLIPKLAVDARPICLQQLSANEEFLMANTKSAKKMVRKIERQTAVNKSRRSRMRTFVRKVEEAITAGDQSVARTALREAEPEIMRSAQKGVLHKNTASRKVSRLSHRINSMGA